MFNLNRSPTCSYCAIIYTIIMGTNFSIICLSEYFIQPNAKNV